MKEPSLKNGRFEVWQSVSESKQTKMILHPRRYVFVLLTFLSQIWTSLAAKAFLEVMTTSPAVLDSTISFKVRLRNADGIKGPFVFRWSK